MNSFRCRILAAALIALVPSAACAQAIQFQNPDNINTTPVSAANPLPVNATLTGFAPNGTDSTPLAATTSSAQQALPAASSVVNVFNNGSITAYVKLGTSGSVTATTSNIPIAANSGCALVVGANTNIAAITGSGSTTLNINGGSGLGNFCYGGGGNSFTGAVTVADGSDVAQGAKADSAYSGSGSGSVIAILKGLYNAIINGVGSTGSAVPAQGVYIAGNADGNLTGIITSAHSIPINISTATTTSLVATSGSKAIYVTAWDVVAGGTGNITLEYGTQSSTPCDTGTTALTGAYNLVAQAGISKGNGMGVVLFIPSGKQLCALTSAAVQMSGSVTYTQF